MDGQVPRGKLKRGLIGGRTAARVGGNMLRHLAARPFLSEETIRDARRKMDKANAETVFACLGMLKGTALKIAQLLGQEVEIFPEAMCEELKKSYNQAPPMNRVLARKAASNALGRVPEEVFASFDVSAFAAASLGQVHSATSPNGGELAVKIQYPGIRQTIVDDLNLVRNALRPLPIHRLIGPILDEIRERLLEEVDYELEARSMVHFRDSLNVDGVHMPSPWAPGCGTAILSATRLPGMPLNLWMETNPEPEARDLVAQRIHDIFLESFYGLGCIHADPNPGNYIIGKDLTVGLVDFGCVKTFPPEFVELYGRLLNAITRSDRDGYVETLRAMRFLKQGLDQETETRILDDFHRLSVWLARLFESERFDFEKDETFFTEGAAISRAMLKHRNHFTANPHFVFLDRTRYGILRLFQQLKSRVRIRNRHECSAG